MSEKVFVGVSGGVDSSVALLRAIQQGYDVTAVFIKTWQPDFIECTWKRERLDAMRVAAHLGVPCITFDAVDVYQHAVAEYMISEYSKGRTPNPDVMCNREVKFGAFLEFARACGASHIATGHYARVMRHENRFELHRGLDATKDQSYFLWTLTQEQLAQTLFPIGDTEKTQVRREAERYGLPTFAKHDSQGVCFLGDIDMKAFLSHYITTSAGAVFDEAGHRIGTHDGALFYTIGQRHGFSITPSVSTSEPLYVVQKDISANTLTVSHTPRTCHEGGIALTDVHLLVEVLPEICEAQFRYRQKPFRVHVDMSTDGCAMLTVLDPNIDMPSHGQSCVLYRASQCLGGGVINEHI